MPRAYIYEDREHAARKLADFLREKHYQNPFVLGLPRGGVVLAVRVARILECPCDVVISRKIGAPGHVEFGIGAISEDESAYFTPELGLFYDRNSPDVRKTVEQETDELRRRVELFRNGSHLPPMEEHSVIVVDDGLATGVTAIAAGKFLRTLHPLRLILAVPLGPSDIPRDLLKYYDELACPMFLENMRSVGLWYRDFPQVEDDEVLRALGRGPLDFKKGVDHEKFD